MEKQLERSQMEFVVLNKKDVHWVEQGRELLIDGHLFDVKKISVINGSYLRVEGLFDYKEDWLYAQLQQSLHNSKTEARNSLFPLLYFQFFFEQPNMNPDHGAKILFTVKKWFRYSMADILLVYFPVDAPPPEA